MPPAVTTHRPAHVWVDGRLLPADGPHLSAFDRGFQLGDGVFETLRARGGHPTEPPQPPAPVRRAPRGRPTPRPGDTEPRLAGAIAQLLAAEALDGPEADASIRITVSRGPIVARGLLAHGEVPPPGGVVQAW